MTQVIETDEAGRLVLPPELLGEAKPHARYAVETTGTGLIVRPEVPDTEVPPASDQASSDEWMRQWRELSEEIGEVWPKGVSAVDVVSEMRR